MLSTYLECGAIACEVVGIAQSTKELVLDIPRRPQPVQVKASGADFSFAQVLESHLAIYTLRIQQRANVAVALRVLNALQLRNKIVDALLEAHIARDRVHGADGGKVVSCDVSGELPPGAIPTAACDQATEVATIPVRTAAATEYESLLVAIISILGKNASGWERQETAQSRGRRF